MSNVPVSAQQYNRAAAMHRPASLTGGDGLKPMFVRSLLQKAESVLEWTLPDGWPLNYFLDTLYVEGKLAVIRTDKYGVVPQKCSLSGYNLYYQPTNAIIANPLLRGYNAPQIGKECTIIRLQPDYEGVMDTVTYYADLMATAAAAAGINILNTKVAYILTTTSKAGAATAKTMMDDILSGKPAVVLDKASLDGGLSWELFSRDVKASFVAPELFALIETLEDRYCTEMGLPNANTQKKERMIVDEVNANNFETQSRVLLWLQELQQSCKDTNAMFGTNLSVKLREESVSNEQMAAVNPGPVSP